MFVNFLMTGRKNKIPHHPRAVNWTDEDTKVLLTIWKEPKIWREIALNKTAKKKVWQVMTNKFNKQDVQTRRDEKNVSI